MTDLKLLTFRGDFRSFKALIAAQYNNVTVELPAFDQAQAQSQAFLAKSPAGKVPVLETSEGPIFESNAIARYVARLRRDTGLLGGSFYESALVDAWVDWTSHELELPATLWVYPILGYMENVESVTARAKTDLLNALNVLEKHLLLRTFLVGEHVTLADIVVASALFYPMKLVLDAKTRRKYPSVERWFLTCVGQTQFTAVVGAEVPLCDKPLTAAGAAAPAAGKAAGAEEAKTEGKKAGKKGGEAKPKAEQKPKAEAKKEAPKPKPAEEEDDGLDEAEIAAKAPAQDTLVTALGKLPRSTMAIDTWKRTYANSRSEGFYPAMPKFWEMLDREGYSVWRCDYNYNEENKVDFMVSNLVSGFVQRSEDMRKYAFGAMQILGAAAPYEVTGMWLFRGQSNAPLLEANPDAEYYTWTKEDPEDPAARERVGHYWCAAETLNGKPIFDCKMFY